MVLPLKIVEKLESGTLAMVQPTHNNKIILCCAYDVHMLKEETWWAIVFRSRASWSPELPIEPLASISQPSFPSPLFPTAIDNSKVMCHFQHFSFP